MINFNSCIDKSKIGVIESKFIHLTTSRSRRNPGKYPNERILKVDELSAVLQHHPEELNFAVELSIHRRASAFDHTLSVSDNHLCVLYEGVNTPVSKLLSQFETRDQRIFHKISGEEYSYTYDKGLSRIEKNQNPVDWQDQIPLFKKKQRKSFNYKLQVMTVTEKGKHAWIRLKTPDGNVYSIGLFRNPESKWNSCKPYESHRGYIRGGGDLEEFLGKEKEWKKTSIVITEEQFTSLTNKIIKDQRQGVEYNLFDHNCASYVQSLLKEIGISYNTSMSWPVSLMPKPIKKMLIKHSTALKVVEVVLYPIRLLQNLFLSCLGIWRKKNISKERPIGFTHFSDFFTKGQVDHPEQLRLVQEILEEEQSNNKEEFLGKYIVDLL